MRKITFYLFLILMSSSVFAAGKIVYLSCPKLDERAPDLKITLDQSNGTASAQSPLSGSGLNFTSQASFGPEQVTWRSDSRELKQMFSIDRTSLMLERKTFSEMTGNTYSEKSECKIIKAPKSAKF
ncbi:hypothetical protein [Sodalis ligni]|uniref:hypothetical protein n=1 Tax=Sodalis ligni TaxID=2697027 RepID=UPI00104B9404|nr:hypothetical protein [Sodalis ligni]